MNKEIDRLIGMAWRGETGPKLQEAYDAALVETLQNRIKQLEEVVSTAINTVECASIDVRTGEELPWYKMARKAMPDFNRNG